MEAIDREILELFRELDGAGKNSALELVIEMLREGECQVSGAPAQRQAHG